MHKYFMKIIISFLVCIILVLSACKDDKDFDEYNSSPLLNESTILWLDIPVPSSVPIQSQTHPSIIYSKNKWNGYRYWLATTPYPKANAYFENTCIYYSNSLGSSDSFIPINQNPITKTPINGFNSDPDLYFRNGYLYCILRSGVYTANGNTYQITIQRSLNGNNWSTPIEILNSSETDGKDLLSPSVIVNDKGIMVYLLNGDIHNTSSRDARNTFFERILYKETDFRNEKEIKKGYFLNSDILKIYAWHFDLFEYDNKLFMLFCGKDYKQEDYYRYNIYMAVSYDYLNFKIYETPILTNRLSYRPSAFVDENKQLILFISVTDRYEVGDGRAVGIIKTNFPELLKRIQR